ncbi:hypothetical protein [Aureimonas ureilytica]|uniref:hypothetical protein n=1 Tax=Aureimonas ureilytica TaxID=401562 RepID=UPI000A995FBB|nr:hypothetical protein [Aureimonas ureilytica]
MNDNRKRVGPEDESREAQMDDDSPSKTPGDLVPSDERGRDEPKSDGNPFVTGDVRSS